MLLEILRRGEILPDNTNVPEEVAKIAPAEPTPTPPAVIENNPVQ